MKRIFLVILFLLAVNIAIAQTAFTYNPLTGRWDASQLSPGIVQSGYPLVLTTTSSSGTTYTTTASPTLTAYTKDQVFTWDVGATGCTAGAVTINIDSLGAKSLFKADGSTNPVAADCTANRIVRIAYDGTALRIIGGGTTGATATTLATGTSVSLTAPRQYYVCTGACTVTPPVPAAGYEFCVMQDDNTTGVITLAALGSSAMYENTARTAYGTAGTGTFVSTGAVKESVCIVGRDATHYLTVSSNGTWTAN